MTRLKELRKQSQETQEMIANILGITRGAYANIENEKREPDLNCLNILAKHYSVSVDYLLGRTDRRDYKVIWASDALHDYWQSNDEVRKKILLNNGKGQIPDDLKSEWKRLVEDSLPVATHSIDPELLSLYSRLNSLGQEVLKERARSLLTEEKYTRDASPAVSNKSAG